MGFGRRGFASPRTTSRSMSAHAEGTGLAKGLDIPAESSVLHSPIAEDSKYESPTTRFVNGI